MPSIQTVPLPVRQDADAKTLRKMGYKVTWMVATKGYRVISSEGWTRYFDKITPALVVKVMDAAERGEFLDIEGVTR